MRGVRRASCGVRCAAYDVRLRRARAVCVCSCAVCVHLVTQLVDEGVVADEGKVDEAVDEHEREVLLGPRGVEEAGKLPRVVVLGIVVGLGAVVGDAALQVEEGTEGVARVLDVLGVGARRQPLAQLVVLVLNGGAVLVLDGVEDGVARADLDDVALEVLVVRRSEELDDLQADGELHLGAHQRRQVHQDGGAVLDHLAHDAQVLHLASGAKEGWGAG